MLLRRGYCAAVTAVDAKDNDGRTPQYWAVEAATPAMASVLARYSAR